MSGGGAVQRPRALFLMGPTGAGKTALAVALVERAPFEIVSVDSAMVYRGMDIGTAKPDAATRARAPHRLIDIRDPAERYSAAEFRDDARRAMAEIRAAGRIPLLVGGTGLYFRALARGLAALPAADPAVRERLRAEAERDGLEALHARLARVDPAAAARIHPRDPQRIQRALEVWEITGRPWSAIIAEADARPPEPVLAVVLAPRSRAQLHERLERRFHAMLAAGWLEEVRALRQRGDLGPHLPSVRVVGYRQLWEYLEGEREWAHAVARGITATRQLAKRQLTWLRGERGAEWLDADDPRRLERLLELARRAGLF